MSTIEALRAKLQDINRRSEAIRAAADAMQRSPSGEEQAKLDMLATELTAVQADIRRLETVERAGAAAAAPPPQRQPSGTADAKRAESMLLTVGIGVGLIPVAVAVLFVVAASMRTGQWLGLLPAIPSALVQILFCPMTLLLGWKAVRRGNHAGARQFSRGIGISCAILQILQMALVILYSVELAFSMFLVPWALGWLVVLGYFRAAKLLTTG